jgi:hypothetical protein
MTRNEQTERMRKRLLGYFEQNPEENLLLTLRRTIEDPLKPRNENGQFRLNPILLLLAALIAFSVCTFLLFSFIQV